MKLTFTQTQTNKYQFITNDNVKLIVAASHALEEKIITIYDNDDYENSSLIRKNKSSTPEIHNDLELIESPDDVLEFCQKYGTLVHYDSSIPELRHFRRNAKKKYYLDMNNENFNPSMQKNIDIDCMVFDHFLYYVKTLRLLSLSINYDWSPTSLSKKDLVSFIKDYIPLVTVLFENEYEHNCDGFDVFLQTFPFYYIVFSLHSEIERLPISLKEKQLEKRGEKVNSVKKELSNSAEYELLFKIMTSETLPEDDEICDTELETLLKHIFSDIINFHLKDIPLSEILLKKNMPNRVVFPSFADAILFQKFLAINESAIPIVCSNEFCKKIFMSKKPRQIYCCNDCRETTRKRNHMRKVRKREKENYSQI